MVPYAQENFFKVVIDVDDYQQFIPWISYSKVLENTKREQANHCKGGVVCGKFDAITKIGFSSLSFQYKSVVSYETPNRVLSIAESTAVFENMESLWLIKKVSDHECEIQYKISMMFANPIYSSVTRHFFDYLAKNINKSFEDRCRELYYSNPNK